MCVCITHVAGSQSEAGCSKCHVPDDKQNRTLVKWDGTLQNKEITSLPVKISYIPIYTIITGHIKHASYIF